MKIGDLPSLVFVVIVVAVVAAIGAYTLDSTKTEIGSALGQSTNASAANYNANAADVNATLDDGVNALGDVTSWLGIIVIVVMGAVIIKLLFESFGAETRAQ